ncbi:E3 ubiquitin-protein ligase bre1 [Coemansia spiralis]|uniref:E3 ubiquitin protein ligase n=2 Tax=Coemansia TaxID=4863 RepID=A0A9W8G9Y0_9FUNG|nr:E3 ubiquitin-protein ligase bre1 [Coemansia umbellata]KAJ2622707.1 E3 ubiquitin-protein ligase bre1 [Coemansia sp. RSA 1358]KAJ2679080.1 E3 ubiquitin-protein ligase bre1 [Coemansia spiralis]
MTERKRRSEDGRDMDDQPPPSLTKKRNTARESDFQALSAEFDENSGMLDMESIREFQKEAIWRQMQEYKRDARSAQQHASDLERRQVVWTERMASICSLWDRAVRDLDTIVNGSSTAARPPNDSLATWLELVIPSKAPLPHSGNEHVDATRTSLESFNQSVHGILQKLQEKDGQGVDWPSAVSRISLTRATQDQVDELKSHVASLSKQLAEKKDMLELREDELRRALKRADRSACPTVRAIEADALMKSQPGSSSPAGPAAQEESDKEVDATSASSKNALTNGTNGTPQAAQAQQDKTDHRLLAERRLAEIEVKARENTQLIMQVDALKLQIASVPDHIIAESALYKQVSASRDYYSAQAQRLQAEVDRLFAEVAELRTSRSEFEETILAESTSQRQALEAEMQRLQNDLVRVRHHRDQIQRELEERRARDAVEDQKSAELKLLSDVRRERMNALISENKRLLAYIAVLKGDRAAFEMYTDEELNKTVAVADELRTKLEQVVRREKKLTEKLDALTIQGGDEAESPAQTGSQESETAKLVAELQSAREQTNALQRRVRKYEDVLGGACVGEDGAVDDSDLSKSNELVAKQKRVDDLSLQCESLQRTSEMMERELQTICESFARLEEQNTSKVWDLAQKEQSIARVVAEKCKYEEKFIGLNKDREAQKMANQALRQQNAKQLEHIKAIEERDRARGQQLALVSNEAQQATIAWQTTQARLQEAQQRAQELEEQSRAQEEKVRVMAAALNERTESLGAVELEKRRTEEALDVANRRVSEAEKTTDQTGLAKLCADYKALLKCPTCQTNFKSHVLLRCMHVFCKQCLDSRIETRQRKCPSCSEPFGAKDVRQIYL